MNLVLFDFSYDFFVGVMYSGEYDACDDVTPSVSTPGKHRGQAYFSSLPGVDIHSE
jgi:hypothetical protein